jgi:hypothetical protein
VDREVAENRQDTTIKNKKGKHAYLQMWQYQQTGMSRKRKQKMKGQEFMRRIIGNVEHEMCDYTGNNWSHRNRSKRFKEKFGSHIRKTFSSSLQKSYTWNITRDMESTAVWNLKPGWCESPLVQEGKYQEDKTGYLCIA